MYVLAFSVLLLSIDLHSVHVKNKMSKREFIRNTRGTLPDDELLGHMYDNIWLHGPVERR